MCIRSSCGFPNYLEWSISVPCQYQWLSEILSHTYPLVASLTTISEVQIVWPRMTE
jgi:hypothetical protein